MKKWIVLSALLFFSPPAKGEMIEFYKDLGKTVSFPYYYEGLEPVATPAGRDHFAFTLDARRYPTQITHYNRRGELSNNKEGWALLKISYGSDGRLVEGVFYNAKGKITLNKDLNFAKEKRFYPSEGVIESRFFGQNGDLLKIETWKGTQYSGPDRILPKLEDMEEDKS